METPRRFQWSFHFLFFLSTRNLHLSPLVTCAFFKAKEAKDVLGWSVLTFNNRMVDYTGHVRRKRAKRLKAGKNLDTDDDEDHKDKDTDEDDKHDKHDSETEGDNADSYRPQAKISILDGDGEVVAHGYVIDDEPKVTSDIAEMFHIATTNVGWYKHIALESICRYTFSFCLFHF